MVVDTKNNLLYWMNKESSYQQDQPSLILSKVFAALAANGILVVSVICIKSTDKIGGKSIGTLFIKGKVIAVITIIAE